MSYKVHFVNDEDFLKLPGRDMDMKVGVAYPEYGEAYVRKSGSNLVDVFSAMHELEHLQGSDLDEHFDAENRCYYKNFANALGPIGTVVGSMFGMPEIGGALGQAGASMFGQGPKQQQSQQPSFNYQPQPMMNQTNSPNVIYPSGGGGSAGIGGGISSPGSSASSLKGPGQGPLQSLQQQQQNGMYSGRNPMSMFGGAF